MNIEMGMTVLAQKKIEKEEFDQIMLDHKKWLEDHTTGERANLRDVDLSEMDLSGIDLSYAYLQGANLMNTKLIETNLSNADLSQAVLRGANLSKAKIDGTCLDNANLNFAVFNECIGKKARFHFSNLWDCNFKNTYLPEATFFYRIGFRRDKFYLCRFRQCSF